jgi:hypothetical protein
MGGWEGSSETARPCLARLASERARYVVPEVYAWLMQLPVEWPLKPKTKARKS